MAFSIKAYRNTSTKLVLVDPLTKDPILDPDTQESVTVEIVGAESTEFDDAKLSVQLKSLELMKAHKKISAEHHKELTYELVASYVVGWNDTFADYFKEELGTSAAFSKENA